MARKVDTQGGQVPAWPDYGGPSYGLQCCPDFRRRKLMRADAVEVSWDEDESNWVVRIEAGENVIRRHCKLPKNANGDSLLLAAQQTLADEGYNPDGTPVSVIN